MKWNRHIHAGKTAKVAIIVGIITGMALAITLTAPSQAADQANSCVKCHGELTGKLGDPVRQIKDDVHGTKGFSCSDCHHGDPSSMDPSIAMNPKTGWVGAPKGLNRITMCASCHGNPDLIKKYNPSLRVDQEQLYWTSKHGQLLKTGDPKPATCSNCHGHHGIFAPSDSRSKVYKTEIPATCGKCHADAEYMKQYGIPTNQLSDYLQSVHANELLKKGDMGAPACNNCHGNHGATPPGIKSIAYVCSQCHPIQQELFIASPHGAALEATGAPSCADCHEKHKIMHPTDELLGVSAGGICTACHADGDGGWKMGKKLKEDLVTLKADIAQASTLLDDAEDHGMPSVDARYNLQQARVALIQSRTLIHSFSTATVEAVTDKGTSEAESARDAALKFFSELKFRKAGLWITWVFIALFILAIYLKVRDLSSDK